MASSETVKSVVIGALTGTAIGLVVIPTALYIWLEWKDGKA